MVPIPHDFCIDQRPCRTLAQSHEHLFFLLGNNMFVFCRLGCLCDLQRNPILKRACGMLKDERGVYRKGMKIKIIIGAAAFSALASLAHSQGVVNGQRSVLGRLSASGPDSAVDFTTAGSTAPVKTGTVVARPAACTKGDIYFATDVTAGQNLYLCTATGTPGTWTVQSGSGGTSTSSGSCSLASSLGFQLNG